MKYHNINHLENICNIDSLMNEYQKDKLHILDLLKNNPTKLNLWELLGNDTNCRRKMKNDSDFACSNCTNISKIINLDYIGEPFTCGNIDLLLTETKVTRPYLHVDKKIKGDAFTLKILFLWLIQDTLTTPNFIELKTAFICNHVGYLLYKAPTINHQLCDFDNLKKIDLYGILSQIIVIFNELKKINFILGNPSIYSFLFDEKACDYNYQNINIKSDYTLCIADVSQSSAIINGKQITVDHIGELHQNNYIKYIEIKEDQYKLKNHYTIEDVKKKQGLDFYLILSSILNTNVIIDDKSQLIFNQLDIKNFPNIWLYKDPVQIVLNILKTN